MTWVINTKTMYFDRLRMAQEIQRQLEEIEVKQKELEYKGVNVEKALRNKNRKYNFCCLKASINL